jgi:hypothetical protein
MMRGRKPNIGPADFQRLNRIVRGASLGAERLQANGHMALARKLRDAALIVAEVDVALATDARPVATKRHGNPAPDETPQTPIRKGRSS